MDRLLGGEELTVGLDYYSRFQMSHELLREMNLLGLLRDIPPKGVIVVKIGEEK